MHILYNCFMDASSNSCSEYDSLGHHYEFLCGELDIASQGDTFEGALANLKEAVELFLESAPVDEIRARLKGERLKTRFQALTINRKDDSKPPRAFSDYEVTIDLSAIPDGIEIIERI